MHWICREEDRLRSEVVTRVDRLLYECTRPGANHWQRAVYLVAAEILNVAMREASRRVLFLQRTEFPREEDCLAEARLQDPAATPIRLQISALSLMVERLLDLEIAMAREGISVWRAAHRAVCGRDRPWIRYGWAGRKAADT